MSVFIAGKINVGVVGASALNSDVYSNSQWYKTRSKPKMHTAKLSHVPCAILESVLAEHGATSTISAHLRSSM
jgi:hypothetical protein